MGLRRQCVATLVLAVVLGIFLIADAPDLLALPPLRAATVRCVLLQCGVAVCCCSVLLQYVGSASSAYCYCQVCVVAVCCCSVVLQCVVAVWCYSVLMQYVGSASSACCYSQVCVVAVC